MVMQSRPVKTSCTVPKVTGRKTLFQILWVFKISEQEMLHVQKEKVAEVCLAFMKYARMHSPSLLVQLI